MNNTNSACVGFAFLLVTIPNTYQLLHCGVHFGYKNMQGASALEKGHPQNQVHPKDYQREAEGRRQTSKKVYQPLHLLHQIITCGYTELKEAAFKEYQR